MPVLIDLPVLIAQSEVSTRTKCIRDQVISSVVSASPYVPNPSPKDLFKYSNAQPIYTNLNVQGDVLSHYVNNDFELASDYDVVIRNEFKPTGQIKARIHRKKTHFQIILD